MLANASIMGVAAPDVSRKTATLRKMEMGSAGSASTLASRYSVTASPCHY